MDQTRKEIERLLEKYGADQFASGWTASEAVLAFRMEGRHIKFNLPLPDGKREGADNAAKEARRRWRALLLVVKAKLEAVATGVSVFDDEFMAHIVMPDGSTIGEAMRPQIRQMYLDGKMPPLLAFRPS